MKKLTLTLFTLLLTQGCQSNARSVNSSMTPSSANAPVSVGTTGSSTLIYATRRLQPDKDDLLHVQRRNNEYCKPGNSGYLPDPTYIVTRSGILRHGYGSSITLESSGGLESMKSIQLSDGEFVVLKERINALREILRSNPRSEFSIKSPLLNPPDYVNGECAIFESFSFADEDGVHEIFERPDFELYKAPQHTYSPAYIQAMDDLKDKLYSLRRQYSDTEGI